MKNLLDQRDLKLARRVAATGRNRQSLVLDLSLQNVPFRRYPKRSSGAEIGLVFRHHLRKLKCLRLANHVAAKISRHDLSRPKAQLRVRLSSPIRRRILRQFLVRNQEAGDQEES